MRDLGGTQAPARGNARAGEERSEEGSLRESLRAALERAREGLLARQEEQGQWCFELEADCTIPAEYVLMMHFLGTIDAGLQQRLCAYLRARQAEHGGWPLFHGGELDVSCSVKAYYALKLAGDDPDAPHMARARDAILARGGAARSNAFTRIALALFGEVPWRATPWVPVELVLLPRWAFFHLSKVSYWTRTVTVPLAILCSLKTRAKNPTGRGVRELFTLPPERERRWFEVRSPWNRAFLALERCARLLEPLIPGFVRRRALAAAERWMCERLNGEDGLGAIFPAMVNAYEALVVLGRPPGDPEREKARSALEKLLVERGDEAYCQPCVSPIWDTGLAALALQEAQRVHYDERTERALRRALDWLAARQILDGPADWRERAPELAPGGWAFQYENPYYPDVDDTSVVAWAMHAQDRERWRESVRRALDWLAGMQSRNGGFGAFDADNTHFHLNEIPFADHGALLDPPTADVSARCASVFALVGREEDRAVLARTLDYLEREQDACGGWFGRWGTNFVYGTWSALAALELAGEERHRPRIERAARWLESVQRADGSFGEGNDTYFHPERKGEGPAGTPFQTAWAILGLCAAGKGRSDAVRRALAHLISTQGADGLWESPEFTAPGFPRVFYLRYHGYSAYFPLWALARAARELARGDEGRPDPAALYS